MTIALISGAKGQDASYLADFLLDKGYEVVSFERRSGIPNYENIQHLLKHPNFKLEQGDITDFGSVSRLVIEYQPDEFYNLAAQSFVGASWNQPIATCEVNFMGVLNCLETIRTLSPATKFFQASTSEVYGDVIESPQNEDTPARPRSPYGASKYAAESLIKTYRDSYNLFACYARSFNHESPRRGKEFVTRKITTHIAEMWNIVTKGKMTLEEYRPHANDLFATAMEEGIIEPIPLGNIKSERDWSHARDIINGFYLMLQQPSPDDFVFSSGVSHSIDDLLSAAFGYVGVTDWSDLITIDPKFFRPADVNTLLGDCSKAKEILGWESKISFESLVEDMMANDIGKVSRSG